MPSQRRKDLLDAKRRLLTFRDVKEHKGFIKRRTKLIRSNWRNGITGHENTQDGAYGDK